MAFGRIGYFPRICIMVLAAVFAASCSTKPIKKETGEIVVVSKFGNVKTSISQNDFENRGYAFGDIVGIQINDHELEAPYGTGYANVDVGKPIVLPSDGYISVAINTGDFAKTYDASIGMPISFSIKEKAGYLNEINNRSVESKVTNRREDYSSDEIFANFRRIVSGNIKAGRLYRSSNPVNPELGRNLYSDDLIRKVGIKTAMNLADSENEMKSYPSYPSSYYSSIDAIALNTTVDFRSGDFNQKLGRGLKFLAMHNTPWLIHCDNGKDQTGFVCMILAALCGSTIEEIVADYMTSYENLYGVGKGTLQYENIAKSNIHKMLMDMSKTGTIEDARDCNLAEAAANYLKENCGLNDTNIRVIKDRLCR